LEEKRKRMKEETEKKESTEVPTLGEEEKRKGVENVLLLGERIFLKKNDETRVGLGNGKKKGRGTSPEGVQKERKKQPVWNLNNRKLISRKGKV